MKIGDLSKKLVAVLGYGKEGKAVTAYLLKHGVKPVLFDQKPWENWDENEKLEIKKLGVNFIFGPDCFKELAGFDIAFRSPGIRNLQLTTYNLQLTSQTKWFFEHCPAKIIGVTGTKGKGTTASLIYEVLRVSLRGPSASEDRSNLSLKTRVYLTGNIGKTQPLEFLDELTKDDWVVYELSSFQLQDLGQSPHIAVVLMTTSEHLDYHRDETEYMEAKSAITKYQTPADFAVINADYENSVKIGQKGKGVKVYFSATPNVPNLHGRKTRGQAGNPKIFIDSGKICYKGSGLKIPVSGLQLRGPHNLQNICAAAAAAEILGVDDNIIGETVAGFKGLEHRLEFVAERSGIKFYNDSFSTTPETAIAAIQSFSEPEILILGGSSKNSDFTALGQAVTTQKNIKGLIIIGLEAEKILSAINTAGEFRGKILTGSKSMAEIFGQIKSAASRGDAVILSPACASFGMFKSYEDPRPAI